MRVDELAGKWFLGTDLPSSTVTMSGQSTFSISYSAVTSPVFGPGGPSMTDINQGRLGDCFLLAPLGEVAFQQPSLIEFDDHHQRQQYLRCPVHLRWQCGVRDGQRFPSQRRNDVQQRQLHLGQPGREGLCPGPDHQRHHRQSVNDGNSFSTIGNEEPKMRWRKSPVHRPLSSSLRSLILERGCIRQCPGHSVMHSG